MTFAEETGEKFVAWVDSLPSGRATRVHIVCDSDADGLPAGALLVRTFRAAGFQDVTAEPRRKGESAWGSDLLDRARAYKPEALIIADLGSRDGDLLPGLPTLLLDHHWPTGVPEGALLLTAYGTGEAGGDGKDVGTTGLMAWWCARTLLGEEIAEQWLWLAGISLLSDLGDKAPFSELARAKKLFGGGALRDATSLLNAPRRTATGNADAALHLLLKCNNPKQLLSGEFPETAALLEAKAEVGTALALARKLPPRFSTKVRDELGADLVAIRIDTPCQAPMPVTTATSSTFRRRSARSACARHALSSKAKAGNIVVLDEAKSSAIKTSDLARRFGQMGVSHALVVDGEFDKNFHLSARNLSHVSLRTGQASPEAAPSTTAGAVRTVRREGRGRAP